MHKQKTTLRDVVYRTKLALLTLWGRWKYRERKPFKWPLMLRSNHDAIVKLMQHGHAAERKFAAKQADEMERYVRDIAAKHMSYRYQYSRSSHKYGLFVQFDGDILRYVTPGDQEQVKMMARMIAHNVESELLTLNFARLAEAVE